MKTKDLLPSIENFIDAVIATRYVNEEELWITYVLLLRQK